MATVKYLDENGLSTVWSKVKGIVTPKADKVSGATAGHLAGMNSSGNLTDSGLAATNVAQKDGSYSGMTVGAAEDLVSAESVASEFTSRITGGSTAVGKGGTALVDKIKGRTLVWNQLLANGNFSNGTMGWSPYNSTLSASNGELTIEKPSASASTGAFARTSITGDPTHKYYMACDAEMLTSGVELYLGFHTTGGTVGGNALASIASSSYQRISQVASPVSSTDTLSIRVGAAASPGGSTGKAKNVILVDLTLMFGAGNEPSTVAEFEALYPGPYYDYNTGTLISNAATAIETVGWNIWDEEWEVGNIDQSTGQNSSGSDRIRSINYIPVEPSTLYSRTIPTGGNIFRVFEYDANKSFLSTSVSSGTFTTSVQTKFIRFFLTGVTTYSQGLCINLSDPSRNGTYEPYWRSQLDLNIPTLTGKLNGTGNSVVIFPDGLRSAGTVFDEIVGNKAIKRIGASNLGERSWTLTGDGRGFYTAGLSSLISSNAMVRYICPRYDSVFNSSDADQIAAADKTISAKTSGNVFIKDSAYTDAATFQAAMSGVTLYYELATPEEYILDEAIPTAMRNDPYGTERRLPEDTAAIVTAPFRADITYSTNIKEAVQSLPQNYINVNSMQDFLAALGTLMGGTWTMRPADGKFDFTFTPNPETE